MSLAERLEAFRNRRFTDEDGNEWDLELLPPMSDAEIETMAKQLPCALPAEVRAALKVSRGFENGALDGFEIARLDDPGFGLEEIFPSALSLAADGFGNYWVVDLLPTSTAWGPIYFACHDAPVIVYQCADLVEFLDAYEELEQSPGDKKGRINFVHDEASSNIWTNEPGRIDRATALASPDAELKAFAESLDDSWHIVDLRNPKIGDGFAWGRAASPNDIKRWKSLPIFAYRPKKSLWKRLFG